MKSVIISIRPYWIFLIIAKKKGWNIEKEKTIEVRKSFPKDKDWDKTVIFYCTKDKASFNKIPKEYQPLMEKFLGKVIGEFVCDVIYAISKYSIKEKIIYNSVDSYNNLQIIKDSCLNINDIIAYTKGKTDVYLWHISDLKIYDKPKEITEFYKCGFEDAYNEWEYYDIAGVNGIMPKSEDWKIKRPPQSWCYVQEQEDKQ